MYKKDNIASEIREKSKIVLGTIKKKTEYRREDLLRAIYKKTK